jgi:hypothetical protein
MGRLFHTDTSDDEDEEREAATDNFDSVKRKPRITNVKGATAHRSLTMSVRRESE